MPQFIAFTLAFFMTVSGWAQVKDSSWIKLNGIPAKVNTEYYNFGNITQHESAKYVFEILNTDGEPLVIKHVTTSCQCTAPSYTKKPIKQGKTASVKIKYDSANLGAFNKSVFVYTNKQELPIKLSITGMVKKAVQSEDKSTQGVSKITPKMKNRVPNSNN